MSKRYTTMAQGGHCSKFDHIVYTDILSGPSDVLTNLLLAFAHLGLPFQLFGLHVDQYLLARNMCSQLPGVGDMLAKLKIRSCWIRSCPPIYFYEL